jgi:Protein of unknown function (DUF2569)
MTSQFQLPSDRFPSIGGVRGWLLVLCLVFTITYPATAFYYLLSYTVPKIIAAHTLKRVYLLSVYTFMVGMLAIFSCTAGVGLWLVKPKAVAFAKRFLLTSLIGHIAYFVLWIAVFQPMRPADFAKIAFSDVIRPMIFVAFWYSYLTRSRRVRETYPEQYSDGCEPGQVPHSSRTLA